MIAEIGKSPLLEILKKMLLIRNFEMRGEAAYQQGKVGGFYHSYMGQEAIQTGCIAAAGTAPLVHNDLPLPCPSPVIGSYPE